MRVIAGKFIYLWCGFLFLLSSTEILASPTLTEVEKLIASDATNDDVFGFDVSISNNIAVIGAPGDDDNGSYSGSAYIYRFDGSMWIEEAKLLASDGLGGDDFGGSVSISGETVVIGAKADDENDMYTVGSAYIFRFNGKQWIEEAKLTASDQSQDSWFGNCVSISGETVVIGAYGDSDDIGAAYVYRFDGNSWIEEVKLTASDGEEGDLFAKSVAISGNTIIAGAHEDSGIEMYSGTAFIYRYNGKQWLEETKLLASDGEYEDRFGLSVAISGNVAIVGAELNIGDPTPGTGEGAAYIYRSSGGGWAEESKLYRNGSDLGDGFGISVSISGDTVLVGTDIFPNSVAYAYSYNGNTWSDKGTLVPSDNDDQAHDSFSYSVSLSGETAVVGAFQDDDNGHFSGSAYIFRFDCEEDVNFDNVVNIEDLLILIADWGSTEGGLTDINGDGIVNIEDLLMLVSSWGPC